MSEAAATRGTIAVVVTYFPKQSETFVYREVQALRALGWDVSVAALYQEHDTATAKVVGSARWVVYGSASTAPALKELLTHPWTSARTLGQAALDGLNPGEAMGPVARCKLMAQAAAGIALAGQLRPAAIEHIHCQFAHAPTSVGMYAARQLGTSFGFVGHANDIFERKALLKRKLKRAGYVSCISHFHREFYGSQCPDKDGKYEIIRCGVDLDDWHAETRPPSERLKVVTVARLVAKKGIDTLIDALALLEATTWELSVVGDGPERAALEEQTQRLGLSQVRFLGAMANSEIKRHLTQADVFALPCRTDAHGDRDGIPVVLMEAMAAELPVVVGDLPAIRELVKDGQSGFLVPADSPALLAQRLKELAQSRELRLRLGAAGRAWVREEFSLSINAKRLARAIAGLIKRPPA